MTLFRAVHNGADGLPVAAGVAYRPHHGNANVHPDGDVEGTVKGPHRPAAALAPPRAAVRRGSSARRPTAPDHSTGAGRGPGAGGRTDRHRSTGPGCRRPGTRRRPRPPDRNVAAGRGCRERQGAGSARRCGQGSDRADRPGAGGAGAPRRGGDRCPAGRAGRAGSRAGPGGGAGAAGRSGDRRPAGCGDAGRRRAGRRGRLPDAARRGRGGPGRRRPGRPRVDGTTGGAGCSARNRPTGSSPRPSAARSRCGSPDETITG